MSTSQHTPRPRARRGFALLAVGLGCLALGASEDEILARDRSRLLAMPPALRRQLWENLQNFQKLDAARRETVRALDQAINDKPETERAQFYAAARRYHIWLHQLDPATREKIEQAPRNTEARLKLVTAELERTGTRVKAAERPPILRVLDLRARSPFDLARDIKVWIALNPAERDEILQIEPPAQREARLLALGRKYKVEDVKRPTAAERQQLYDRVVAGLKNKSAFDFAGLGLGSDAAAANPQLVARMREFIADNAYFREHPPAPPVHPDRLVRFMDAVPDWIRGRIEPLSPLEARRRLTVLYRIVYPAPAEIPLNKAGADSKATPATKKAAPTVPTQAPNPTQRIF